MTCRKVDVALGVVGRGAMAGTLRPRPALLLQGPPDAHILSGLDPRGVLDAAGLVEVERQVREQDVGRPATDDDGTPGRNPRVPHPDLVTILPRHKVGLEHGAVVGEIHRRIIRQVGIHDRQIQRIARLDGNRARHVALAAHGLTRVDALVRNRASAPVSTTWAHRSAGQTASTHR